MTAWLTKNDRCCSSFGKDADIPRPSKECAGCINVNATRGLKYSKCFMYDLSLEAPDCQWTAGMSCIM
jgi:hypothetical protein